MTWRLGGKRRCFLLGWSLGRVVIAAKRGFLREGKASLGSEMAADVRRVS